MTAATRPWACTLGLVPLVFVPDIYEGALLPKLLILQLGLLYIAVRTLWRPGRQILPGPLLWAIVIWSAAMTISLLQSANPTESFAQLSHYLTFAIIPLLLAVTLSARDLLPLFRVLVWVSLPIGVIGVVQYFGIGSLGIPSTAQPSATFFHRNAAAAYLAAVIPLSWYCYFEANDRSRALYAGAMSLALAYFVFTRTRGAWVGVAVATVAVLILYRWQLKPGARDARALRTPIVLAVVTIVLAGMIPERAVSGSRSAFDDKKASALGAVSSILSDHGHRGRPELWRHTLSMIADHPLFGVGIGNWEFQYPAYAGGEHLNIDAAPRRPHNDLLWITSETGIVGLGAFLGLLGLTIGVGLRTLRDGSVSSRHLALVCIFIIVAHSVDGMFNFPRERPGGASLFWVAIGGLWTAAPGRIRRTQPGMMLPVILVSVLAWATQMTVRRAAYDYHHLKVHVAERAGDWQTILEHAPRASAYGSFRANTYIALGRAHYRTGSTASAIEAYEKALSLHPNSLNAHNNLGIAYRRAGRTDEAVLSLKTAIRLYPGFTEAYNNLGNALRDRGELDASIEVFEGLIRRGARIPQIHVNLGRSYREKGELLKARISFMNALKLDPQNRAALRALEELVPARETPLERS